MKSWRVPSSGFRLRPRRLSSAFVPLLVAGFTLLLSSITALTVANNIQTRDRLRFRNSIQNSTREIQDRITTRVDEYIALLRGTAGLLTANENVDRATFEAFVDRLHLQKNYQGIQGIGFARRVLPQDREAIVARMRQQGFADFHLWPESNEPDCTTIQYLFPLDARNQAALGFDMYSLPARRAAMERARDTGEPSASAKLQLVQEIDNDKQAGFLIYLPVYHGNPQTIEERRAALVGYAYSPFRAGDLLSGIEDTDQDSDLQFSVYDNMDLSPRHLLYQGKSLQGASVTEADGFPELAPVQVEVAGRKWTLTFAARPTFGPSNGWGAGGGILLGGAVIALVLFLATHSLVQARAAAERSEAGLRESRAAVEHSEHRFRTLFEQSPLSIQIFAPDGLCLLSNHAWQSLWGTTLNNPRNYNILEDSQIEAKGMMPYIRRGFAGETVLLPPVRYDPAEIGRIGRVRWVQASIYPVKDEQGLHEVVLVLQDVTDVKEAQEAVQRSEDQLRLVIDALPVLIAYVDREERYQFNSRGYEEWFGEPVANMAGLNVREVLGEESYAEALPYIRAALAGQEVSYEATRTRANGEQRITSVSYVPHRNAHGEVEGFVSLVSDITDRKRIEAAERAARAEAEAANRTKDEFLATLSHELRTPLNAILGWAQVLRLGGVEGEDIPHALETIERNAKAQAQLVEDLLDLSRIISGKLRLELQKVDLPAVVEAALDSVRPTAEAKGVRLIPVLDSHATPVLGDAHRLQQVIWNLLSNAIKFTPKGGRVEVFLQRLDDGQVEIAVTDTGQGISPEFLPYVFERLRQADSSSTRRHGGLGLGLSIVRHLVELHGGSVRAQSRGDGKGATFTVTLPLADLRRLAARSLHPPESLGMPRLGCDTTPGGNGALAGVRVLVVDDEADTLELLGHVLRSSGAQVTTATSVQAAVQAMPQLHPDVLISDISMPDEDGYSLIRRVRSMHETEGGRVPAVALTARARKEDRREALLAGYQMHLSKPIEPTELCTAVATLVKGR